MDLKGGNRLLLLESGRAYFPALEAACAAATREIRLETYIFEDDVAGQRIAHVLERAAERGVQVYLLVDGYGSRKLNPQLISLMVAAGVRFLAYRPVAAPWPFPRQRLRRMHRKLAVIDGELAFVGGINIIDDMHTPGHTPPRFDYAVRVQGPLVGRIHVVMQRLWTVASLAGGLRENPSVADMPQIVDPGSGGTQHAAFLVRDNLWHRSDIEDAYLHAIAEARSEVLIANAYFLPGARFRHALAAAAGRGVRVILLLQGRVEYVLMHYASRALYGSLLEAGIEIHEYHKSFLHAKVAVIDGRWATVGSSNIDPFSLLLAREANLFVVDDEFAGALRNSLLAAMGAGAHQVQREKWSRQPLSVRVTTWVSYGFARLLTGVFAYGQTRDLE